MRKTYIGCPEHDDCIATLVAAPDGVDCRPLAAPAWAQSFVRALENYSLVEITHQPAKKLPDGLIMAEEYATLQSLQERVDYLENRKWYQRRRS